MQKTPVTPATAVSRFPFWEHLTESEQTLVRSTAVVRPCAKNEVIAQTDKVCTGVVFLLCGSIRVSIVSEEGREITLYRLREGDTCVTTASCVIRQIDFETLVTATEETDLLVIPASVCDKLMRSSVWFRACVFETETMRFSEAIRVVQDLVFKSFDRRLAAHLLALAEERGTNDLTLTQEELAVGVNSAREVVARMLKRFSGEGLVAVKRGHILLTDPKGLKDLL
ncbi:MAG: Crp/Fnr family transcriptional regulator [Clostridia bacterium]|nr:Crp/Fnr family transcriptional regulator [Clostridia bacterium]